MGEIEPGPQRNFENSPFGGLAEPDTLATEAKSFLRNHEEVIQTSKQRVGLLRHVGQVRGPGMLRGMSDAPTPRTEIRRLPERGSYDRDLIRSILDEALICHIGFVDEGAPVVIPAIHARLGDTLYLHGSPASRMLRSMRSGEEICVTVTLVDGLVVARAAFHNSMNYRSVVVFGAPRIVTDADEKRDALEAITEHVIPGRWADSRPMTEKEQKGTLVAALAIAEASAKVRTGGPIDDDEDSSLPIWAGVIPLAHVPGAPVHDARLEAEIEPPAYVTDYSRPANL